MSRDTPDIVPILRRCESCYASTPFVYKWYGMLRCRECLRDMLLRAPKGAKRRALLRLLDGPEIGQAEFDFGGQDDGR
jgi:ribosomal protein S14